SYMWSNGATSATLSGLSAGTYLVTVIDSAGCQVADSADIIQPPQLDIGITSANVLCKGDSSGIINATIGGGTAPYSGIIWSDGQTEYSIGGLGPGNYSATVTDANGCHASVTVVISEPDSALSLQFNVQMVTCYGHSDGSIAAIPSGGTLPYTAIWSNGSTGQNISGISSGNYSVTITDINSCKIVSTAYVPQINAIVVSDSVTGISCAEADDGIISLIVEGGQAPYEYIWSPDGSQTGQTVTGLNAGEYIVTVTDFYGCAVSDTFTVPGSDVTCLFIPNVITPNDDGVNDDWNILGIEYFDDVFIEIFNRWGDLLFTYEGPGDGYVYRRWDGHDRKGRELPHAVYLYILDLRDGSKPRTGTVTIIK
ncbi:MAG: gliding motility-associated C-terminal domain-containing protein, partial [Bacteroidetes bacterium]|nr:gliding motility-associated C-terminal domain-containing protein [Bacteroidota bacterium]